ncbi:family 43 glycosylhydrolase, partial [Streptomyces galilaeus]|uniref:family 43 glycosylhydrolase n=1 Tax=Streptomyces galilaeus TaxID=33899 RepID=UPI0038F6A4A3
RVVWTPPTGSWNSYSIWAPELHFIDGKWYIYYAAGKTPGSPYYSQRTGVLECDTPLGDYVDKGMVYTGDDPAQEKDNV